MSKILKLVSISRFRVKVALVKILEHVSISRFKVKVAFVKNP